jgi:hypothetical protein
MFVGIASFLVAFVLTVTFCTVTNKLFGWFDDDAGPWEIPVEMLLGIFLWGLIFYFWPVLTAIILAPALAR